MHRETSSKYHRTFWHELKKGIILNHDPNEASEVESNHLLYKILSATGDQLLRNHACISLKKNHWNIIQVIRQKQVRTTQTKSHHKVHGFIATPTRA